MFNKKIMEEHEGFSDLITGEAIISPMTFAVTTALGTVHLTLNFETLSSIEPLAIREFDWEALVGKKVKVQKGDNFSSSEYDEAFETGDPFRLAELFFGKHGYWGKANQNKFSREAS